MDVPRESSKSSASRSGLLKATLGSAEAPGPPSFCHAGSKRHVAFGL
jgi:hypothetical protein